MAASSFFRRSLAHDDVDRYNTWAVLLFSILALIAFLMPLSPILGIGNNEKVRQVGLPEGNPGRSRIPEVKASCWCPAQFEESQVSYTNALCTGLANGLLRGIEPLEPLALTDVGRKRDHGPGLFRNDFVNDTLDAFKKDYFNLFEKQKVLDTKTDEVNQKTRTLMVYTAPLVMFLLALCLKLPHILWTLLTNAMTCCVNVDQVLESCVASRPQNTTSQRQACDETVQAVASSVQKSRNTTSSLFLFMKLLTTVVIVAEVIVVGHFILPGIHSLESDSTQPSTPQKTPSLGEAVQNTLNQNLENQNLENQNLETASRKFFAYPKNVYHCAYRIRQMTVVHDYTVQCIISYEGEGSAGDKTSTSTRVARPPSETPTTSRATLQLYQALFTAVLALLAILAVANVFNVISWFLKLIVGSYATSVGLPSNAAMDVVLLVHMARLNVGPCVSRGLASSSAWSNAVEGHDKQPMMEATA